MVGFSRDDIAPLGFAPSFRLTRPERRKLGADCLATCAIGAVLLPGCGKGLVVRVQRGEHGHHPQAGTRWSPPEGAQAHRTGFSDLLPRPVADGVTTYTKPALDNGAARTRSPIPFSAGPHKKSCCPGGLAGGSFGARPRRAMRRATDRARGLSSGIPRAPRPPGGGLP